MDANTVRLELTIPQRGEFYYFYRPDPPALVIMLERPYASQVTALSLPMFRDLKIENSAQGGARVEIGLIEECDIAVQSGPDKIVLQATRLRMTTPPAVIPVGLAAPIRSRMQIKRVVIDAGHGGWDSGASYGGIDEKDLTLSLALKLQRSLQKSGRLQVVLTRRGDYYLPLRERTLIANQYQADLFLSVHVNAALNKTRRGFETYFCSEEASDRIAAQLADQENSVSGEEEQDLGPGYVNIEDVLFKLERRLYWQDSQVLGAALQQNTGIRFGGSADDLRSANFSVLRHAAMPALLLEVGFLSHTEDRRNLQQTGYLQKIADSIQQSLFIL